MPYYGVAQRRVRPGRMDSYLASARAIAERWATPAGQLSYRLCLADDDPDGVMLLTTWPSPALFEAASATMPEELRRAVAEDTAALEGDWRWYRSLRTIERFAERATWVIVLRFDVGPDDRAGVDAAVRAWMDEAIARTGVVSLAYLAAVDEPGSFLTVGEYADAEAVRLGTSSIVRVAEAARLCGLRQFTGRVGYLWDRADLLRPG